MGGVFTIEKLSSKSLSLSLFIYCALAGILLLFIAATDFNLTGYTYDFDKETMVLTIKEGYLKKKSYDVEIREVESKQILYSIRDVMYPINRAQSLWKTDIYIISLFIAGISGLFYSSLRQVKNFKRYVTVYILIFALLISWEIKAYQNLFEDIRRLSDYTNSLRG
ncbi:hypothetical protein [Sporosarcina limicola]|uniref:Uncharacterized protein n=1 Tax=Sporosarcina limicola TaxID=34101 RepID=A0A927MLP6_9BACL|nr:hypothetical protein [Sporosarcina limicola]MBE1553824.1 hypothetical protein [Sporosarcina limicola]